MFRRNLMTVTSSSSRGSKNLNMSTNTSLDFNGTTHKLATAIAPPQLALLTNNTQAFSYKMMNISAWIYPHSDGEGNAGTIISKGKWFVQTTDETTAVSDNKVKIKVTRKHATQDRIWETAAIVPINVWSHIYFSIYDYTGVSVIEDFLGTGSLQMHNGNLPFILNGSYNPSGGIPFLGLVNTQTGIGDPAADGSEKLYVGAINALGGSAYDGLIANLAITKDIPSVAKAEEVYNNGQYFNHNIDNKLRGWWRMGDGPEGGVGDVIVDGGFNNNLTGNSIPFTRGLFGT